MIRINLLPVRAFKRRENIRLQVSIFIIVLIGIVAAMVLYRLDQVSDVDELLVEKEKLINRWEAQQKAIEILSIQNETMALLDRRISLIIDLIKQRSGPVKLLDEIIKRTPSGEVWLTELVQRTESIKITVPVIPPQPARKRAVPARPAATNRKAKVKEKIITTVKAKKQAAAAQPKIETKEVAVLTLKGVAKDNQFIARYIKNLEDSLLIENVKLINSRQINIGPHRLKQFQIKCIINYLSEGKSQKQEAKASQTGGKGT